MVGAGPAGDSVAAGLRSAGFQGGIKLVGAEPVAPYERPHLSKGFLLGTVTEDGLALRPAAQYAELGVELVLGERVADLGVERHAVELESGRRIEWDLLCVATGSSARRLPRLEGALHLRELADARELEPVLARREALDVVGAGFIGCEVAAAAVARGCRVRVFEALEQPLVRALGPELGAYLARVHREHGVELHLGVQELPEMSGAVLVGAGSAPNVAVAEDAGLAVDRGVLVDALGRTSAPGVYGAGDVTRFESPRYAAPIRVEHFQTARRQGFAVGRAMAGAEEPYSEVPWFWSDQHGLNIQYAGAGLPWDEIAVRGELARPPFAVFYLAGGELVGAAGVDDHHTVARARRLMEKRVPLTREQMEDPAFDLRRALP